MFHIQKVLILLIALCTAQNKAAEYFISDIEIKQSAQEWIKTYIAPLNTSQQRIVYNMVFVLQKMSSFSILRKNAHAGVLRAMKLESKLVRHNPDNTEFSGLIDSIQKCSNSLAMSCEANNLLTWMEEYTNIHGDNFTQHALEQMRIKCAQEVENASIRKKNIFATHFDKQIREIIDFKNTLEKLLTAYQRLKTKSTTSVDEYSKYQECNRIALVDELNRTLSTHFKSLYYHMYPITQHANMMSEQSLKLFNIYLAELASYLRNQNRADDACRALFSSAVFGITEGTSLLSK